MHLVLLTRGIQRQVEEWKSLMLSQRFPWKRKNLTTGKEEVGVVQGALRPIQFWEYVFPEESLNDVLTSLRLEKDGGIQRPEIKKIAWLIRKMLKLDQIPILPDSKVTGYIPEGTFNGGKFPALPVHNMFAEGVAVYPLGIKKDPKKDYPQFKTKDAPDGYFQEGL